MSGTGFIYIIEVDETQSYINLNDDLYQFLLLPHSIIRIIHEFKFGDVNIVLCRLFRTPTNEENVNLYNKLLGLGSANAVAPVVYYKIEISGLSEPFECLKIGNADWKITPLYTSKLYNLYSNSRIHPLIGGKRQNFYYFSLGQENELYVSRGLPLEFGGFADIKYTLHQHFIKDCYKALDIPCIDYYLVYSEKNNSIATGILEGEIKGNRNAVFEYDVNNFFIDCIFKFDRINNVNNMFLKYIEKDPVKEFAKKIENFKDAGLYMNGTIDPFFSSSSPRDYIGYLKTYKNVFSKYEDASDEVLEQHLVWCKERFETLNTTIETYKVKYIEFINANLKTFPEDLTKAGELIEMIEKLADTLTVRTDFYYSMTSPRTISSFRDMIKRALSVNKGNVNYSTLYKDVELAELKLPPSSTLPPTGGSRGRRVKGKGGAGNPMDKVASIQDALQGSAIVPAKKDSKRDSKNIIYPKPDLRMFKDMPHDIQEYYGGTLKNDDKDFIDVSGHCYVRLVSRTKVNKMITDDKKL